MSSNKEIINGVEYSIDDKSGFKFVYPSTVDEKTEIPSVICKCGNDKFKLQYGFYSLIAHCSKCGSKDTVYSG